MANGKKNNRSPIRKSGSRSYGKLKKNRSGLGVLFEDKMAGFVFIHADKLLDMWHSKQDFTRIKARTRDPEKLGGFWDGEILGYVETVEDNVEICVFYGSADKDLVYDFENGELHGVVKDKFFVLPQSEFEIFIDAIELL